MKTTTLVGITLVVLLGALACYLAFAPPPECLTCKARTEADAKVAHEAEIAQQKADSERAAAEALRLAKVSKVKMPLLGTPYDYAGAVMGDNPKLPHTRLCRAGILIDLDRHKVLWAKNPRSPFPIASMSKVMSTLLVLEAMEQRDFDWNTQIQVSPSASRIGGSQVYLDPKESFSVDELIQAVIIHSANDATELLAEYVGGDRSHFVSMMNDRAAKMGLRTTRFFNPHGLPPSTRNPVPGDGDNVASPEEVATMSEYLLQYNKATQYAATVSFNFGMNREKGKLEGLVNSNHNLLKTCQGCNGLKTGFTKNARFCVSATCERGGRRMVAVVMGVEKGNTKTGDDRAKVVRELFDWGFAQK